MSRIHFTTLCGALLSLSALAQPTDSRLNVAFLVWDGMELIESMGPAHVFSFAPGMDEFTVSKTTNPLKSEFITIVPQYTLEDCPQPDVIVIPGGTLWTPMGDPAYRAWLQSHVPQSKLTLSVCNSAILLADLGLLDGREATCGDANLDDVMLLGKDVKAYINRRWVHSGNIITSESYLAGTDAAIYAVRVLRGEEGEKQVLNWSNYHGDLSKFDTLHAEPGVIPISRRREVYKTLMSEGVDAAARQFRRWVESGRPAYTPPLDRFDERNLFQWMAWGNQRLNRHDTSLRLCEFKAEVWPDSAEAHAYLGEALMKAGRPKNAIARLLVALELDPDNRPARKLTRKLLEQSDDLPDDAARRARAILGQEPGLSVRADEAIPQTGRVLGKEPIVGGPCEGCEAVFEGLPAVLSGAARIAPPSHSGEPMRLEGTVLLPDGRPAAGMIVYAYHTDPHGIYPKNDGARGKASYRHGVLRGWVRTDESGSYRFDTIRPGGYPGSDLPAHVHMHVIEPGRCTYYIDDVVFTDDPRLTGEQLDQYSHGRGGSGVATPRQDEQGVWRIRRDIILGRAIPGYPNRPGEQSAP